MWGKTPPFEQKTKRGFINVLSISVEQALTKRGSILK